MGASGHRCGGGWRAWRWALALGLVLLATPGVVAGTKLALDLSGSSWELTGLEQSLRLRVAGAGKSKTDQVLPETTELTLDPAGSWQTLLGDEAWFGGAEWVHKSPTKRRVRLRMTGDDLDAFAEQLVDEHIAAFASDGENAEIVSSRMRAALKIVHASDGSTTGLLALRVAVKGRLTSESGARRFQLKLRCKGETQPVATVSLAMPPAPPHQPIVADFVISSVGSAAPLKVHLANQSTGTITGYQWSFGQGLESSLPNPTTIYAHPGEYPITLMVGGPLGTEERTKFVTVQPGPPQPTKQQHLFVGDSQPWGDFWLRDTPMTTPGFNPLPAIGFGPGLEAVFKRVLPGSTNDATQYGVTLSIHSLAAAQLTLRWTLVLVDGQGQERILFGPHEQTYAANTGYESFSFGTTDGPLMDGQPGDTLEFRLANVSPNSGIFWFWLNLSGSYVTVPSF